MLFTGEQDRVTYGRTPGEVSTDCWISFHQLLYRTGTALAMIVSQICYLLVILGQFQSPFNFVS